MHLRSLLHVLDVCDVECDVCYVSSYTVHFAAIIITTTNNAAAFVVLSTRFVPIVAVCLS